MKTRMPEWKEPFRLASLDDEWDDRPSTAGVYVIQCGRPLDRVGGTDKNGIVYIGKSSNLRDRLWMYWYAEHDASACLWSDLKQAARLLGKKSLSKKQLEEALGSFTARTATPLESRYLQIAERATLYVYAQAFGELPPTNFAMPDRWGIKPNDRWMNWARLGLGV